MWTGKDFKKYYQPENFYAFLKEVLVGGFELLEEKPHAEMCYFVANRSSKRKKMLAVPRECYKTTILNGFVIYDLCRHLEEQDYTFAYLLDSATANLARTSLMFIKRKLEFNNVLRERYGQFRSKNPGTWSRDHIIVKQQFDMIKGWNRKEPSIMSSSVESNITGYHFKTIVADDWVTEKTTRTSYGIHRSKERYAEVINMLDKNIGRLYILCTFWHYDDVYSYILRELPDEFDLMIRPIYTKEDGRIKLFFPKKYSWSTIQEMQRNNRSRFYTQFLLQPIPDEEKPFPDENYQEISERDIPEIEDVYIAYDPADEGVLGTSSLDAIGVIGTDKDNNMYVLDLFAKQRISADVAIHQIINFTQRFKAKLRAIIVEKVLFYKFIKKLIEDAFISYGVACPLVPAQIDRIMTKKDRLRILEVPWRDNKIFVRREIEDEYKEELKEEFKTFDKCRYFDVLDMLAMVYNNTIRKKQEIAYEPKQDKPVLEVSDNKIFVNMTNYMEEQEKRINEEF